MKTSARRDGDHYVINGAKTFISNGLLADLVVVACRTDPDAEKPHKGISLIVVETGMEGFTRGRKLDKIGQSRRTPRNCSSTMCGCRWRICSVRRTAASTS